MAVLVTAGTVVEASPAAAAATITVTPNTGLVDGQTVTLSGSGWQPNQSVAYCEGVPSSSADPSNCNNGSFSTVSADGNGDFSVSTSVQRLIFVPSLGHQVDCADPAAPCVFGAASVFLGAPVSNSQPLQFAPVPPLLQLANGSVTEGDVGTTSLSLPVTLSYASTQNVTVQFATVASGTDCTLAVADPATDYTPTNGTLTFAPGETSKTVTINVNGDTLIEPDECIEVSFTNPTNATLSPSNGLAFGTIVNDDPVTIVPGAGSVVEGDSGTTALNIPITLSRPYPVAVSAQWTTFVNPGNPPCQADPATDYTPTSGTANFAPGATTETATVSINGDTLVEPDECVLIKLQNPTNAKIGGFFGIGIGTITNDDSTSTPTVESEPTPLPPQSAPAPQAEAPEPSVPPSSSPASTTTPSTTPSPSAPRGR
jgi:Neocarzinostatin family/Calx-beta domain